MTERYFDFKREGREFADGGAWLDKNGDVRIWLGSSVFSPQDAILFARQIIELAGSSAYKRAFPCRECGRLCARKNKGESLPPGLLRAAGQRHCGACYSRGRRNGTIKPRPHDAAKVTARIALDLRREQNMTWSAIAQRIGKSEDAVEMAVRRFRAEIEAERAAEEAS